MTITATQAAERAKGIGSSDAAAVIDAVPARRIDQVGPGVRFQPETIVLPGGRVLRQRHAQHRCKLAQFLRQALVFEPEQLDRAGDTQFVHRHLTFRAAVQHLPVGRKK